MPPNTAHTPIQTTRMLKIKLKLQHLQYILNEHEIYMKHVPYAKYSNIWVN
jgi:hypothetical protein